MKPLILLSLFIVSCNDRTSPKTEVSNQGSDKESNEQNEISYTAVIKENEIHLVASWNLDIIIGSFSRQLDRNSFLHYPKDRPKNFSSAQQIYYEEETNSWQFSDNYVKMASIRVYPGKALTRIKPTKMQNKSQ